MHCQKEIEGKESCNFQCAHCQEYYMPLAIEDLKNGPKALILENGFEQDIPDELIEYLDDGKIQWYWYDMRQKFWPENRDTTAKFFATLPEGQLIACHTVFEDYQQLELMIELLHKLMHKKFTVKIMHGCLAEELMDFFQKEDSSIPPRELEKPLFAEDSTSNEIEQAYKKLKRFKKEMNIKFLEVLEAHEIYWVSYKEILFKNLKDIKKALL